MGKLTKKIRIKEYDVIENEFKISFQLAGYVDDLPLEGVVTSRSCRSVVLIEGDTDELLMGLGFSDDHIGQMVSELLEWLDKSRKSLGGHSHIQTIQSRFEVVESLKEDRRAKAAVERIQIEAPSLDWAMSVTKELVDEHAVPVGSYKQSSSDGPDATGTFAFMAPNRPAVTTTCKYGTPAYETSDIAWIAPERGSIDQPHHNPFGTFFSTPLKGDSAAAKSMRSGMETAITAMEAAGLGEEPATVDWVQATRDAEDNRYQYRRKVAEARTDAAIDTIHTHARRFTTPMSLREHDFLRSIIQEEIERVIEGLL